MTATIIPGTCGACAEYGDNDCRCAGSPLQGQRVWSVAAIASCPGYRRSAEQATPVDPRALAAVER